MIFLLLSQNAVCILHLDYSFISCFLHWHREDALEALPSQTPPASKILKGEMESRAQAAPAPAARQRAAGGDAAEPGRLQEGPEPAKVSHQSEDTSGGCPDFDTEQLLRQEGGLISRKVTPPHFFQAVKSAKMCPNFRLASKTGLQMYAPRSPNKLTWLPGLKPTGCTRFPEGRAHVLHPWSSFSPTLY